MKRDVRNEIAPNTPAVHDVGSHAHARVRGHGSAWQDRCAPAERRSPPPPLPSEFAPPERTMGRTTLRVALMLMLVLALPLIVRYNALTGMVDRGAFGKKASWRRHYTTVGNRGGRTLTYFVAVNFFNSADVLSGFVPELKRLLEALGPQRCYVSIWENGSSDGTKGILRALKRDLDAMGVGNSVNTSEVSMVDLCVEAGLESARKKPLRTESGTR